MKDYSKMSYFELNVQVAEREGINWYCPASNSHSGGWEYCMVDGLMLKDDEPLKDYCNNPQDAWPIMEEHKIGLAFVNGEWRASSVNAGYHEYSDKSAFRAAMIVYLMMKDAE